MSCPYLVVNVKYQARVIILKLSNSYDFQTQMSRTQTDRTTNSDLKIVPPGGKAIVDQGKEDQRKERRKMWKKKKKRKKIKRLDLTISYERTRKWDFQHQHRPITTLVEFAGWWEVFVREIKLISIALTDPYHLLFSHGCRPKSLGEVSRNWEIYYQQARQIYQKATYAPSLFPLQHQEIRWRDLAWGVVE